MFDNEEGVMMSMDPLRVLADDDELLIEESTLTDAQDKALSLLPLFSGALSIWGSVNIILMVLKTKSENRNCYKRIMLGLSCSDVVTSFTLMIHPFLLPADTRSHAYAIGNSTTCTMMGFFKQFGFATFFYNVMLSLMFVLKIKYGVSEEALSQKYEPWMHGVAIGFPLITAVIGLALQMYDVLVIGHFCWFTGTAATFYAYFASAIPGFLGLITVPLNNWIIYRHVRQNIKKQPSKTTTSSSQVLPMVMPASGMGRQTSGGSSVDTLGEDSVDTTFSNEQSREQAREQQRLNAIQERQQKQIQAIAFQASLYVASFLASYLPFGILRAVSGFVGLDPSDEAKFFPLLLLQAIFLPLQGFFNFFIYNRNTSYLRAEELSTTTATTTTPSAASTMAGP